jgi:hypothetical protein
MEKHRFTWDERAKRQSAAMGIPFLNGLAHVSLSVTHPKVSAQCFPICLKPGKSLSKKLKTTSQNDPSGCSDMENRFASVRFC